MRKGGNVLQPAVDHRAQLHNSRPVGRSGNWGCPLQVRHEKCVWGEGGGLSTSSSIWKVGGGGGGGVHFRLDMKSWGRGVVHFKLHMKSGGGGGGGCPLKAQYEKRGVVHFKLHIRKVGGGCPLQARYVKWGEGGLSTSGSI